MSEGLKIKSVVSMKPIQASIDISLTISNTTFYLVQHSVISQNSIGKNLRKTIFHPTHTELSNSIIAKLIRSKALQRSWKTEK